MAVTFNIQFRISVATKVIRLIDTSTGFTYGIGCFKVEFPNGVVRNLPDFSTPDITASVRYIDVPCEVDASGNVITGSYSVSFTAVDNLSVGQTPLTRSFDFNWVEPANGIANFSDVITPEIVFKDLTSYSPVGSFTGVLTRTITGSFPSTSEVSGSSPVTSTSTNTVTVVSGANYYEGVYTPTSAVSVAYTHSSNAWLTILYTRTFSATYAIKKCPNQLDLVTKINSYRAIIDAYKTTNDTQFNILSEQYDLVIALYSHLIARYNTTTQDGSEPILRELLSILEPYSGTYTYQSTKMFPFELAPSANNSLIISDGTNTDTVTLGSTLTFGSGNSALVPIVTNNNVTYSPTFGTLINTFAQGNDSRFHNPVTIGTANGLSISTQALSLAAATTGSAGAMSASDKTKLDGIASGATANVGTVTSVALSVPAAFSITGSPVTTTGTLAISATGTSLQYITGTGALATLNTANVPENTNLYFTSARARTAIALTTTGTSGVATYDNATGIINIPNYVGGVTSFNTRTGAIVLSGSDVTTALSYTPYNATNPAGYISSITSGNVTSALGYTPYNATNPSAYIALTSLSFVAGSGSYNNTTGVITIPTNNNQITNGAGYITGITSGNVTTALGFTPENAAKKGVANGYASLDGGGLVPSTQLPSYVDDVLEYTNLAGMPATGETGKIYVALDTNKIYRWSGTTYIEVSPSVGTIWGGIIGTLSNQTDLQSALNAKQASLSGTGFVKSTAGTISYDTNTYLTTGSATTTYVPYTGASGNVNLGTNNISANNFLNAFSNITASGTQVVLTVSSAPEIVVNGSGGQVIKLPDATTLANGASFLFNNNQSSGAITVNNNSNTLVVSVPSGGYCEVILIDNSTAAGSWDRHFEAPANVSWSTNTFDYAGSITSATWNGNVVQPNRGGTGQSTYTDGQLLIGNTSGNTLSKATLTAGTGITITNGNGSISIANSGGTVTSVSALTLGTTGTDVSSSVATGTTTPVITLNIPTASATNRGALSAADWTTFNNKQTALGFTPYNATNPNNYIALTALSFTAGSGGYNSTTGVITIPTNNSQLTNGANYITLTSLSATGPIVYTNTTGVISIPVATTSVNGYLSSADWTTFNNKANALSGTTNKITKFTSTTAIGDSSITDTGSLVTIASPLTLSGAVTGVGNISNYTVTASGGSATSKRISSTLVASANSDVLVGLDINPTFTNGAFTGVTNAIVRINGSSQGFIFADMVGQTNNFSIYPKVSTTSTNYLLRTDSITLGLNAPRNDGSVQIFIANAQIARFFPSGNFTLQNGGTFTDAGYRLDVAGTTRFQGTTASDTAPLGSELAGVTGTGTNWALAGGATNLNVGGYTHTVGSTTAFTTSLAAVNGTYYQIVYTITGRTAGSITIAYGGASIGVSSSGNTSPLASSTAVLTITPTTDFDGTVVLSIKSIGTSSASSTFANSSGTSNIEVRASSVISNTFIGLNAGSRNTTGSVNTFLGYQAGQNNTTGFSNTIIGATAGKSITVGSANTLIGSNAGANITTTNGSTIIGRNAGANITTVNATIVGDQAGANITTGSNNVIFGGYSLTSNLTGSNNSILGAQVLQDATSVNNTIAIGLNAGRYFGGSTSNILTTIDNSILIGTSAYAGGNSQTNQIVIGYQTTGLGSNTTVLGNSSTVTTAIYGNLLLGSTVDSGFKLDVTGTARVSGVLTLSSTISNGTFAYTLPSATGTLALTSALSGYLPLTGGTLTGALGGTSATFSGTFGSILNIIGSSAGNNSTYYSATNNTSNTAQFGIASSTYVNSSYPAIVSNSAYLYSPQTLGLIAESGYPIYLQTGGLIRLTIASTGAATFSSSVSALSLDVISSSGVGSSTASGLARFITAGTTAGVSIGQSNSGRRLDLLSYGLSITGTDAFITNTGANAIIFENNATERMRITSAGNVGIGTSSPSNKLEVIGTTKLSSAAGNVTGINIIPGSQTNIFQTIGDGASGARFYASIETTFAGYENTGSSQMVFKTETKGGSGTSDTSVVQMVIRPTGDIRMTSLVGSGSRAVMADANGQLSASVSDITLKENITPIGYGLNEIMQMNPVWFDFVDGYKNYGEGRQNGNIAQEIEAIIPEAVFTTPQTGKMGINYEQLHAVYIKAIQEQQVQIEELKTLLKQK